MVAFSAANGKCRVTADPRIELTSKKFSGIKQDANARYLSQAAMRATASRISSAERA
jgi:hypothetical protein